MFQQTLFCDSRIQNFHFTGRQRSLDPPTCSHRSTPLPSLRRGGGHARNSTGARSSTLDARGPALSEVNLVHPEIARVELPRRLDRRRRDVIDDVAAAVARRVHNYRSLQANSVDAPLNCLSTSLSESRASLHVVNCLGS